MLKAGYATVLLSCRMSWSTKSCGCTYCRKQKMAFLEPFRKRESLWNAVWWWKVVFKYPYSSDQQKNSFDHILPGIYWSGSCWSSAPCLDIICRVFSGIFRRFRRVTRRNSELEEDFGWVRPKFCWIRSRFQQTFRISGFYANLNCKR